MIYTAWINQLNLRRVLKMEMFELFETIDNEEYFVKVFKSECYNLNIIRNKEFNYKTFEVSLVSNKRFIPLYLH